MTTPTTLRGSLWMLVAGLLFAGMGVFAKLGVASGFCAGTAFLTTKHLGRLGEPNWRVVLYFTMVSTIGAGAFALFGGFHAFGLEAALVLLGLAVCGTLAQLCMTRAYSRGDTLTVGSLGYSTVVFTTLFSIGIWQESVPLGSWLAMALIIASGILAARAGSSRELAHGVSA